MTKATIDGIRLEPGAHIDWIVFDRPDAANSFNAAMLDRFSQVVESLRSTGAPVIGIRAEGKGFGAGMDLGEYDSQGSVTDDVLRLASYVDRWKALAAHPKPVLIAIHGYCIGVAAQIAAFADILIVAEDAQIREPVVPIGGGFITPTWVGQVGGRRAKEFAFIPGNTIDGKTAVAWGLANAAVPAANLTACAEALAERMAKVPAGVLAIKKRSINRALQAAGFDAALAAIAESDALLHADPRVKAIRDDLRERGIKALRAEFDGPGSQDIFRHFAT